MGLLQMTNFSSFRKENLRQLVIPFAPITTPDIEACQEYRLLTKTGNIIPLPLVSKSKNTENNKTIFSKVNRLSKLIKSLSFAEKFRMVREYFILPLFSLHSIRREISNFKPDIVYALVGGQRFAEIVYKACSQENVPLFIHITDDYIKSLYENSLFSNYFKKRSLYWFQKITDYATGHAGIFRYMAEEYSRRFGGDWTWFTTLVSMDHYNPAPRELINDKEIRLLYTGHVGLGRIEPLKSLSDFLWEISIEASLDLRFEIRVFQQFIDLTQKTFCDNPIISVKPWVPENELPKLFHENDILVHVESFDPEYARYTRLSFSTKISQYMMAGRCILSVGPPQIGTCRAVNDLNVGMVLNLTRKDSKELLKSFLLDKNKRDEYAQNARKKAIELFEIKEGSRRFRNEMEKAVERFQQRQQTLIKN
jgi:spore maturation protein CgeB